MSIFDIFRPKKKLSDKEEKWNKMWELWEKGEADSPYAELMEYESEINDGGHDQYFLNVSNCGDLEKSLRELASVLPAKLNSNLQKARKAYDSMTDENEDEMTDILDDCDDFFYENEELVEKLLQKYADTL